MEPVCYIVGAMEPGELRFAPHRPRLVIAADRGLYYLERRGIRPDLIVGDFDSLGRTPEGENVLRHPVEKDDTDMLLAVKEGLARGLKTFVLYGGLGGRPDHAYANLQTLTFLAERGAAGYLLGRTSRASGRPGRGHGLSGGPDRDRVRVLPRRQGGGSGPSGDFTIRWRTPRSPAVSRWASATGSRGGPPGCPRSEGPCWSCGGRRRPI